MRNRISELLKKRYGLHIHGRAEVAAGWSAAALRASTDRGDFFVKVYDRTKPSTRAWVERLDVWLPVAQWLGERTPLAPHMSVPVRGLDGAIRVEDGALILLVYPFISGETVRESRLTREQARALGRIVGMLHAYGADVPLPLDRLTETYEFPFLASLRRRVANEGAPGGLLAPYASLVDEKIDELRADAARLSRIDPPKVLCHADIHGWNLMRAEHLVLVDWESLLLAPPEADFFSFTDTFFFGYAWDDILSGYRDLRPGFSPDPDALAAYRLRRRLEDIAAFVESIREDDLTPDALAQSMSLLTRECGLLRVT